VPELAIGRHPIPDRLLELAQLREATGLGPIEEDLSVESHGEHSGRPTRNEGHLGQLRLEGREQLLGGPAGAQQPATPGAVFDLDAGGSLAGHAVMIPAGATALLRFPASRSGGRVREALAVPEYPDLTIYVEALEARIVGQPLEKLRIQSPSLLKSVSPAPQAFEGRVVRGVSRLGKRLVFELDDALFCVLHLMIAGRLRWKKRGVAIPRKRAHAAFDFPAGSLLLTEASTKKRMSLHLVQGSEALAALDPGGLEVFDASPQAFREALLRERHTLKRSLTDPHLFSGIGNAYSDEILHRAGLSPVKMSDRLSDEEHERLFEKTREVLLEWTDRLRQEVGEGFPDKVTAFRPEMAVHGRFREPCPVCGTPVQRIVRAENEVNYCPGCQTGGKILADRALSRLLGKDWPRTLEELERRRPGRTSE